jgi:hypothetical protein
MCQLSVGRRCRRHRRRRRRRRVRRDDSSPVRADDDPEYMEAMEEKLEKVQCIDLFYNH